MFHNITFSDKQLRTVLFHTETGRPYYLNHFHYAEQKKKKKNGEEQTKAKASKSSYSFGLLQFDIGQNAAARKFLMDNGFTQAQIDQLEKHGGLKDAEKDALDAQLQAIPQDKMDAFTNSQLQSLIGRVDRLIDVVRKKNPAVAQVLTGSQALQLRIADFFNQYGSGYYTDLVNYLEGESVKSTGGTMQLPRNHAVTAGDIDIQEFINEHPYNHKDSTSHQIVVNRAKNLDIALRELGLTTSSSPAHASSLSAVPLMVGEGLSQGRFPFQDHAACPPNWLEVDESGFKPPEEVCDQHIIEGLF